jgi:hypothetical protein
MKNKSELLTRVKRAIKTILANGDCELQSEIVERMGYTTVYASGVLTGRHPMPNKFIANLLEAFPYISSDFIYKGIEPVIKPGYSVTNNEDVVRQEPSTLTVDDMPTLEGKLNKLIEQNELLIQTIHLLVVENRELKQLIKSKYDTNPL